MAIIAPQLIGPKGRNPDYARNENQYARMIGANTFIVVKKGGGMIHLLSIGAPGVLAKFYDVASTGVDPGTPGTLDNTTEIATVDTSSATAGPFDLLDVAFSAGLVVVTTGGTGDLTLSFRGAQTLSPLTFGTQLDGNNGRTLGTSSDKTVPDGLT